MAYLYESKANAKALVAKCKS